MEFSDVTTEYLYAAAVANDPPRRKNKAQLANKYARYIGAERTRYLLLGNEKPSAAAYVLLALFALTFALGIWMTVRLQADYRYCRVTLPQRNADIEAVLDDPGSEWDAWLALWGDDATDGYAPDPDFLAEAGGTVLNSWRARGLNIDPQEAEAFLRARFAHIPAVVPPDTVIVYPRAQTFARDALQEIRRKHLSPIPAYDFTALTVGIVLLFVAAAVAGGLCATLVILAWRNKKRTTNKLPPQEFYEGTVAAAAQNTRARNLCCRYENVFSRLPLCFYAALTHADKSDDKNADTLRLLKENYTVNLCNEQLTVHPAQYEKPRTD